MSHHKQTHCLLTKISWLFDKLFDNNVSNDGLYLATNVAVNGQISKVILTPGNDTILVA